MARVQYIVHAFRQKWEFVLTFNSHCNINPKLSARREHGEGEASDRNDDGE